MANKQYIGARYVPKFYEGSNGNNWDSGKAYEPLTVVTYLQDSYTSKIPVPNSVGDPAHNPKYWAHTGAYNAQVEEYREEVLDIQSKFETMASSLVNVVVEGISNTGVSDVSEDIQDLLNENVGKKIYFPAGDYIINSPVTIPDGTIIECDSNAYFHATRNTGHLFIVGINPASNLQVTGIVGGQFDGTNVTAAIIFINDNTYASYVDNVYISNCRTIGIQICSNNQTSSQAFLNNIRIIGTPHTVSTGTGIMAYGTDNYFMNINIGRCKVGINFGGSGTLAVNVHVWNSADYEFPDNYTLLEGFNSIRNSGNNRIANLHVDNGYHAIHLTQYNTHLTVVNPVFNYDDKMEHVLGSSTTACMLYYTSQSSFAYKSSFDVSGVMLAPPSTIDASNLRSIRYSSFAPNTDSVCRYPASFSRFEYYGTAQLVHFLPQWDEINNALRKTGALPLMADWLENADPTKYYKVGYICGERGDGILKIYDGRGGGYTEVAVKIREGSITITQGKLIRFAINKQLIISTDTEIHDGKTLYPIYLKYPAAVSDSDDILIEAVGGLKGVYFPQGQVLADVETVDTVEHGVTIDLYSHAHIVEKTVTPSEAVSIAAGGYEDFSISFNESSMTIQSIVATHTSNANTVATVWSCSETGCIIRVFNYTDNAVSVNSVVAYCIFEL